MRIHVGSCVISVLFLICCLGKIFFPEVSKALLALFQGGRRQFLIIELVVARMTLIACTNLLLIAPSGRNFEVLFSLGNLE